jgi:hypothetical protein
MANTYTLIEAKTLTTTTSSVTFTSIPQTYTDLVILSSFRSNRGNTNIGSFGIQFNGTGSNLTKNRLLGDGSSASSAAGGDALGNAAGNMANSFSSHTVYIPNYTSANYKSFSIDAATETNSTSTYTYINLTSWLWSDTAAITSIEVRDYSDSNANSLVQYSTFYLYGIKNS